MVNTAPAALLPLLPLLWVIGASAMWWRQLSRPWLFVVSALLALLGIQFVISLAWKIWSLMGGLSIAMSKVSAEEVQRYFEEQNRVAVSQAILLLLAAIPFLWWLRSGLSVRNKR
jgi:hypothetical protein